MDRYDAIRAAHPDLILNLYGFTPQGPVTLEIIAPDGYTAKYYAETAAAVFDLAFPVAPENIIAFISPKGLHDGNCDVISTDLNPAAAADLFE